MHGDDVQSLPQYLMLVLWLFQVELQDDKKSYYFASGSDIEMDKWVQALSEAAGLAPE